MWKIHIILYRLSVLFLAAVIASSCASEWLDELTPVPEQGAGNSGGGNDDGPPAGKDQDREIGIDTRKVLLLYSAGVNSLSSYLASDIRDLSKGWLPKTRRTDDVLLVYSHIATNGYSRKYTPTLTRLYTDNFGNIHKDTLVRYNPDSTVSSSAGQVNKVLSYIKERFPAKSYGMIFSSHATGYLPAGYYNNSSDDSIFTYSRRMACSGVPAPVPYVEVEQDPSLPMVKSIGQDVVNGSSYEMELKDFAEAIPMKLDYLLFDACLMGGVETAYELKDKCSRLGASQTEVLAEGFNYETLTTHLLKNKSDSDPESVCKDYYTQYDIQSGVYRSATISLINCEQLDSLATVCKELFDTYRDGLENIDPYKVQRFFRGSKHWFYDLESIVREAGASEEDMGKLQSALDRCIIFKGNTPSFMGDFNIDTFSGLSMYLPCNGSFFLDQFYKSLKWNEATGLVK